MNAPPATIGSAVAALTRAFADAGLESAARDARVLVAAAADVGAGALIAHPDQPLDSQTEACIRDMRDRRLGHEPVARILGYRDFYGRTFKIGPDVLDPRPDTETLIDLALKLVRGCPSVPRPLRFLDIGTGSGCIAVTLLAELPEAIAVATDVSPRALAVAGLNAAENAVAARLELRETDVAEGVAGPFDLIVSNPPYIATGEIASLAPDVRCHDPSLALDGGPDGLDIYRKLAATAPRLLSSGGWIVVEVGIGQADAVEHLLCEALGVPPGPPSQSGHKRRARDLAAIDRCVAVKAHSVTSP